MDSYYKNIVYKKNAFEDLKTYLKINYLNKNILLVSSKSILADDISCILNSVFCGSESVSHYVVRNNFDKFELNDLAKKIEKNNYQLIIVFGGGKCCDVVKYFAYKNNLPYIVCPSSATSLAFFTSYCVNPFDQTKSFYAKMPNKIFIQEAVIRQSTFKANLNAAAEVYPYPIAAPRLAISTIHNKVFLPKKGAIHPIAITKIMAFFGVLYFGCKLPNHSGSIFSLATEYKSLLLAI